MTTSLFLLCYMLLLPSEQHVALDFHDVNLFGDKQPSESRIQSADGNIYIKTKRYLRIFSASSGALVNTFDLKSQVSGNAWIANFTPLPYHNLIYLGIVREDNGQYEGSSYFLDMKGKPIGPGEDPELGPVHYRQVIALSSGRLLANIWIPSAGKSDRVEFREIILDNLEDRVEVNVLGEVVFSRFFTPNSVLAGNKAFLVGEVEDELIFVHAHEAKAVNVSFKYANDHQKTNETFFDIPNFANHDVERNESNVNGEIVSMVPNGQDGFWVGVRTGNAHALNVYSLSDKGKSVAVNFDIPDSATLINDSGGTIMYYSFIDGKHIITTVR